VELPESWKAGMQTARQQLQREQTQGAAGRQSPMEWARIAALLLETMGWPGFRPESSVEFQVRKRWDAVLEACGSLGFDGTLIEWSEFVAAVGEAVSQTIFAAESTDARVQVTEPLESAGQLADGIWFLGAHEENWPGRGAPHPLLPIGLQRDAEMPHANPQTDWALAEEATERLLHSAEEVVFTYPRQAGEGELRPSRLVAQRLGDPLALEEIETFARQNLSESFADEGRVPFLSSRLRGGAATLTRQSLCPLQAFATARLGAEDWSAAEVGLNAKQRGQLLHKVPHRVWGGAGRGGISNSAELAAIGDLRAFVAAIVAEVMQEGFAPEGGKVAANGNLLRFPARFLKLEAERLTRLVVEWLGYELARLPFRVESTEVTQEVTVAGIAMRVRLDRVDELPSGAKLIVDYKSSNVGPSAWRGDRPDDVQLPLYATYAVLDDLEGLVFGRVRPSEVAFCGRVRNAKNSLRADLSNSGGLVRDALTEEQLEEWRGLIERLGEDFVAGRAEADPKNPVKTCGSCHLQAVCRIYERQPFTAGPDEEEDGGDESDVNGAAEEGEQHG
jgi:probable DNA repair protein